MLLRNLGPTANPEKKVPRGAIGNNSPSNQKPPPASNVRVTLSVKKNEILEAITEGKYFIAMKKINKRNSGMQKICTSEELVESPHNNGYICCDLINQSILHELIENHEFIILNISMNINKNYFNIEELIESSVASPM